MYLLWLILTRPFVYFGRMVYWLLFHILGLFRTPYRALVSLCILTATLPLIYLGLTNENYAVTSLILLLIALVLILMRASISYSPAAKERGTAPIATFIFFRLPLILLLGAAIIPLVYIGIGEATDVKSVAIVSAWAFIGLMLIFAFQAIFSLRSLLKNKPKRPFFSSIRAFGIFALSFFGIVLVGEIAIPPTLLNFWELEQGWLSGEECNKAAPEILAFVGIQSLMGILLDIAEGYQLQEWVSCGYHSNDYVFATIVVVYRSVLSLMFWPSLLLSFSFGGSNIEAPGS